MAAPAWVIEAQARDRLERTAFAPVVERLNRQWERGLITMDEFVDECIRARAQIVSNLG